MKSPVKIIYDGVPETYGSYSVITEMEGRHTVCFENPSASPQKVSFHFLGGAVTEKSKKLEKFLFFF